MTTTISAKVPEELADEIEAERDEGESRSACINRLLRDGLDDTTTATEHLQRIAAPRTILYAVALFVVGLVGVLVAPITTTTTGYALTLVASGTAILTAAFATTAAMLAQLALARPLRGLVGLHRGEPT